MKKFNRKQEYVQAPESRFLVQASHVLALEIQYVVLESNFFVPESYLLVNAHVRACVRACMCACVCECNLQPCVRACVHPSCVLAYVRAWVRACAERSLHGAVRRGHAETLGSWRPLFVHRFVGLNSLA